MNPPSSRTGARSRPSWRLSISVLHAAARDQRAVARVGPLVIRANEPADPALRLAADLRAAMPADVPQSVDLAAVVANDDQRIGVRPKCEVVARIGNLARVPGKQPAAPPNALELRAIHQLAGIEFAGQAVTRPAGCNQLADRSDFIRG